MNDDPATEMPHIVTAEDFEPFVGSDASFAEVGVTLTLVKLERYDGARHGPRTPFLLIFSGPRRDTYLLEGLYRCVFGDDKVFDIHVAPIATLAADRQDYQAVFN